MSEIFVFHFTPLCFVCICLQYAFFAGAIWRESVFQLGISLMIRVCICEDLLGRQL